MTHEVIVRGDKELALYELETRFAMAVRQRELLENYIKERLTPDKHFYTVGDEPGRKPSLTKEGAELICLPHALKGHYEWLSGPENPPLDDSPYQITMKCIFENNGKFEGEGVGSASSMVTKKDGTRVQRQRDPGLRHNATIKMGCKSAYIAATLNSTAASEFFTQDLEDDQTGTVREKPDAQEHWCAKHHTKFFKTPKMKAWAHPVKNPDGSQTVDDNGKPLWCSEKAEQPKPQAKTAVADEPEEQPEKPPEPTPQVLHPDEETPSPIQLDWLKERLDALQGKGLKAWSNVNVVSYLNAITKQKATKVSEVVKYLTREQAEAFVAKIQEAIEIS